MEQKNWSLPTFYGIWAEARPDSPLHGQSGFLSERGQRLVFPARENAERKIRDLRALCLNRSPAAEFLCTEYPGDHDITRSVSAEQIRAHDLKPDLETLRFEVTQRIYGNTGGGCMVGTLAVRFPDLDKAVWINCNEEGVTITSADYVWNEDLSDSWDRYEDVVMMELSFLDNCPADAGPLYPAIQEAVAYTIRQKVEEIGKPFPIPAQWLPDTFRQNSDQAYLSWADAEGRMVMADSEHAVANDPEFLAGEESVLQPDEGTMTMG